MNYANPEDLKNIILNIKTPQVIKNLKIPWKCFDITLQEWIKLFDTNSKGVNFEFGSKKYLDSPQWESTRKIGKMTGDEFLNKFGVNSDDEDKWGYYSYKYLKECPVECRESVNFDFVGFPEIEEDISFWLGSKNSHTPCHYDTYGCNIIVQCFGRKSWLLFSPDCKMKHTRVPYEESSVYSIENFYSPGNKKQFKEIAGASYHIITEPGDVLIVPKKWWHFVENLEVALSFNTWVPLNFTDSSDEIFKTLDYLIATKYSSKKMKSSRHPSSYLSAEQLDSTLQKYNFISSVKNLSENEFFNIIDNNSKRFDPTSKSTVDEALKLKTSIINSVCNPQTILLIKEKYITETFSGNL